MAHAMALLSHGDSNKSVLFAIASYVFGNKRLEQNRKF